MLLTWIRTLASLTVMAVLFTGCITPKLLEKHADNERKYNKTVTLVEDSVIAFGTPAQKTSNLPSDSLVIAGQKNSYILTQGGKQFVTLISKLDPKNIQIQSDLRFFSEKNDGHFKGKLPLSYVKPKANISKTELEFYIQNGAQECSTGRDKQMQAQRFCFNIDLAGVVYPKANNADDLKTLSQPYQVSIYTKEKDNLSLALNDAGRLVATFFGSD